MEINLSLDMVNALLYATTMTIFEVKKTMNTQTFQQRASQAKRDFEMKRLEDLKEARNMLLDLKGKAHHE